MTSMDAEVTQRMDSVVWANGDGWQHVYVVNEVPGAPAKYPVPEEGDFFLRNNGGTLELADDLCKCNIHHDRMETSVGGYNRDGLSKMVTAFSILS